LTGLLHSDIPCRFTTTHQINQSDDDPKGAPGSVERFSLPQRAPLHFNAFGNGRMGTLFGDSLKGRAPRGVIPKRGPRRGGMKSSSFHWFLSSDAGSLRLFSFPFPFVCCDVVLNHKQDPPFSLRAKPRYPKAPCEAWPEPRKPGRCIDQFSEDQAGLRTRTPFQALPLGCQTWMSPQMSLLSQFW